MKDEKKNKRRVLPENEKKKKVKKINPKHQQEQDELFSESDRISPVSKKVNEKEFVELNNGDIIDLEEYFFENYVTEKATHFYKCFYNLIADLLHESREIMFPFVKPLIVPMLKRKLIYGRFPNAVQRRLYKKNPYTGYCTRTYWNYQLLSKKADLMLRDFIDDFQREGEKVLASNGNMRAFIIEYCINHGLPIQLELFGI